MERNAVPGAFGAPRAFGSVRSLPAPMALHHTRGLKPIDAEKPPPPCFKLRLGSLACDAAGPALPVASMPRVQTYDQAFLSSPPPAHPRRFSHTKTTHALPHNHDQANDTILKGVHLLKAKIRAFKSYPAHWGLSCGSLQQSAVHQSYAEAKFGDRAFPAVGAAGRRTGYDHCPNSHEKVGGAGFPAPRAFAPLLSPTLHHAYIWPRTKKSSK